MRRLLLAALAFVALALFLGAVSASGTRSAGPSEPIVFAFAVPSEDASIVYAGTDQGVFQSVDAGLTWRGVNDGLSDLHVFGLAVARSQPSVIYAVTVSGIFKSTDAARNWRPTALHEPVLSASIASADGQTVYAGGNERVFRTTDGGETWEGVFTEYFERFFALAADPRDVRTLYAGGSSGVFKTTDGGSRWASLSRGLFDNVTADEAKHRFVEGFVYALTVDPSHSRTLYLGSDRGVFKTVDGGQRWRPLKKGMIRRDSKYKLVTALAINPNDPKTVYASAGYGSRTGTGLFKTTNGGRSWRFIALPDRKTVEALTLDVRNPKVVYAATTFVEDDRPLGHLFKSADGGRTWRALTLRKP